MDNELISNQPVEDASRLLRLCAALLDVLILLPLIIIAMLILGIGADTDLENLPMQTRVLLAIIGLLLYFVINWSSLQKNAQTLGKKITGIRIVNLDNEKPRMQDLLIKRYIPYFGFPYIPLIGGLVNIVNLCFIFGATRRCLHDRIAGTRVIKS